MPLQTCAECPLKAKQGKKITAYKGRAKAGTAEYCEVPFRGPKTSVDVMIVGESPGTLEIMKRQPFIGESGDLVDKELRKNGLDPSRIFFANACRCMLEKDDKTNKKLLKSAMTCCRPALEKAIKLLKPKLIVCFGDVALTQVLKQSGITKKRGIFQRSTEFDCFVFPTFHPAACFRDQGKFAFWNPDMAAMARFVREGFVMPEAHSSGAYSDVDSIRFILEESNFTAALDTETQGKDWVDPNSVVISYSVSIKEGEGYNVWLCQECEPEEADKIIQWPRKIGNKKPELVDVPVKFATDYDRRIAELRELCQRPDIKLTMMNGNYDLHRLHQLGIPREEVVSYTLDIQLAAHALDPDNFTKASMSNISDAFLSGRADHKAAFKENVDMSDMLKAAKENPERHTMYAAEDTDKTLCCANVLRSHLRRDTRLTTYYAKLAHPVQSLVLYDIEKNGIPFDMAKLPETKERIAAIIRQKEQEFLELVPSKIIDKHRDKGLKLTRADFVRDVFFSKQGFKLPVLQKTPSGDPTTDRKVLVRLRDELDDCQAKEAISLLIEWGPYQKLYSTYLKGFEAAVRADGRLHTNITKTGTATGRTSSCIRKGSLVETCRDVSKFPHGVPIESVVAGDYVYSFDDNAMPTIKKVLWAGKTGVRDLVRVHYRNQKGDKKGFLDCTPEHRIRLATGEYVEAQNLEVGMSVCSIARMDSCHGYQLLWATNRKSLRDHRFVYEQVNGGLDRDMVVHHIDGNRNNNHPSNLEALSPGEHSKLHFARGDFPKQATLSNTHDRRTFLRFFAASKGRPTKMGFDFTSAKNAMAAHGLDWAALAKRYNRRGEFISRGMIKASANMTQNQALAFLGVGYYRWKELMEFCGVSRDRLWANQFGKFTPHLNNHIIEKVEVLGIQDEVYDLHVEDTHNFVVGGISVHNSAPNLQNIPKRNKVIKKAIRSMLVAPQGKILVAADYSQSELRWIAHESGDRNMRQIFLDGHDMHRITGQGLAERNNLVWDNLSKEDQADYRQKAKPVNFGLPYGQSAKGFQAYARDQYGVHFTLEEAETYRDAFLNTLYPGLPHWHDARKAEARKYGFVRSAYGFIRRTPNISSTDIFKQGEDERIAVNTGIQSASNDSTLLGALEARRSGLVDDKRAQLVLFIHDELIYAVDEDYVDYFVPRLLDQMSNLPTRQFGFEFSVPLIAEATTGLNLAEMKDYEV